MTKPRIYWNPWKFGFVLFSIWRTEDFWGFVICNLAFEWPKTKLAFDIHESIKKEMESWTASQ